MTTEKPKCLKRLDQDVRMGQGEELIFTRYLGVVDGYDSGLQAAIRSRLGISPQLEIRVTWDGKVWARPGDLRRRTLQFAWWRSLIAVAALFLVMPLTNGIATWASYGAHLQNSLVTGYQIDAKAVYEMHRSWAFVASGFGWMFFTGWLFFFCRRKGVRF